VNPFIEIYIDLVEASVEHFKVFRQLLKKRFAGFGGAGKVLHTKREELFSRTIF
jgi:hypothetical protein